MGLPYTGVRVFVCAMCIFVHLYVYPVLLLLLLLLLFTRLYVHMPVSPGIAQQITPTVYNYGSLDTSTIVSPNLIVHVKRMFIENSQMVYTIFFTQYISLRLECQVIDQLNVSNYCIDI
jgi:hypothetical protein